MTIVIKGKEYELLKAYPSFVLCKSKHGWKECFSYFEVNGVPKIRVKAVRLPVGKSM